MAGIFHPVPLTVEIRLEGEHSGDYRITTVHYRYGATGFRPTETNLRALGNYFMTQVYPHLAACVVPATRWHNLVVTDINDAAGARAEIALVGPYVGTRTGNSYAGNVQVAMVKHVTSRRRGANGRLFVPDLWTGDIIDSVIQPALDALLQLLAMALFEFLTDGTNQYRPVVASKKHASFANITSVSYDSITDELITRLKGHRKHRHHHVSS